MRHPNWERWRRWSQEQHPWALEAVKIVVWAIVTFIR
jgi:hypothetical protein